MLLGVPDIVPLLFTVSLPPSVTLALFLPNFIAPEAETVLPFAVVSVPFTVSVEPALMITFPFMVRLPALATVIFAPLFNVSVVPLGTVTSLEIVTLFFRTYFLPA